MAIEARFCQDLMIDKPVIDDKTLKIEYKPTKIDNKIQSFIYRDKQNEDIARQKILISANTENNNSKQEKFATATLSHRHIPNTLSGFSATIFYDIKESNTTTHTKEFKKHFEYIIAFRGTESTREIV